MNKIIFIAIFSIATSSCNSIFMKAYGIKDPKERETEEIWKMTRNLGVDTFSNYLLIVSFFDSLELKDPFKSSKGVSETVNKYMQPLQVLYFDKKGSLISHHANCYAPGFPNLKWNTQKAFDVFPAKSGTDISDQIISLPYILKFLQPLNDASINKKGNEYTVLVFWNFFMLKQSKNLISTVLENIRLNKDLDKVNIIFVNNDNIFYNSNG